RCTLMPTTRLRSTWHPRPIARVTRPDTATPSTIVSPSRLTPSGSVPVFPISNMPPSSPILVAEVNPTSITSTTSHSTKAPSILLGMPSVTQVDASATPPAITDKNSHTTFQHFDDNGNLWNVTDPLNGKVVITYGAFSRPTSVEDATHHFTLFSYDANG